MNSYINGLTSLSLRPDEILVSPETISFQTRQKVDVHTTRLTVGVRGVDGFVQVASRGNVVRWVPSAKLTPGSYVFNIDGLVSKTGRTITEGGSVRFYVVNSRARISRTIAVESMARLRIGPLATEPLPIFEPAGGKFVEVFKGENRKTGRPMEFACDQSGRRVNMTKILRSIAAARAKKFGKLHEDLYNHLRQLPLQATVRVAVWVRLDRKLFDVKKSTRSPAKSAPRFVRVQEKAAARAAEACAGQIEALGGEKLEILAGAPVVLAVLNKRAIRRLEKDNEVSGIFLYEPEGIEDLGASMAIAKSAQVHSLGIRGANVKVAVWERGPDTVADLSITDRYLSSPSTSGHSRLVHGIIKNTQSGKPRGHARSCRLHSANSYDLDALRWAVREKGCTVINQSFHRSSEPGSATLSFDDIYKDWLVLNWPFPTICQAAGNFFMGDSDNISPPIDEYVNHKGYNSLAVGNHNDSASAMSGSSVFRNADSPYGDRELPEISANGTSVTAAKRTSSGTSFASPAVAGAAALIQSTHSLLKSWPEGCRAILLAGATRNVRDDTWWSDVVAGSDARDGSGALNSLESHRIAKSRRTRNAAAARRGWDVGTLQSSDFNSTTRLSHFSYRIEVPGGILGPRKVKVCLAWDSKVDTIFNLPINSRLTVDFDLKIYDKSGVQVGYSGSWDNSYEIAEFTGEPGETYTIRIRRWSGTDSVWYGIAWTVTGDSYVLTDLSRGTAVSARQLFQSISDLVS